MKVEIIDFQEKHAEAFAQLNFEWLDTYFYIEDYDREVLTQPKKYILDKGGKIFMATVQGEPVGTVALIYREPRVFELSKMAVSPKFQGLRIGQKLMYFCINKAAEMELDKIYLDSNTRLTPAISLYQKVGFSEIPVPTDTPYERCNIRMELKI